MHHPTDRIIHTTDFVMPVVEHWLEQKMGPPHEGSIRRLIAPWASALTTELHLAHWIHTLLQTFIFILKGLSAVCNHCEMFSIPVNYFNSFFLFVGFFVGFCICGDFFWRGLCVCVWVGCVCVCVGGVVPNFHWCMFAIYNFWKSFI